MSIIIGLFIAAGTVFIYASIKETNDRKKECREAEWRRRP